MQIIAEVSGGAAPDSGPRIPDTDSEETETWKR